jgi:hypothetical protein
VGFHNDRDSFPEVGQAFMMIVTASPKLRRGFMMIMTPFPKSSGLS